MTNKTKELVAAGYALAKDLHCAESAALVRELATQLDVQLSRSNALAAENAGLKESEVPLGAIENGRAFADRLEAYPFECEGGNLNMCSDWQEFRRCFEHLSEWAMHSRSETPATDAFLAEVRASAIPEGYVLVPQEMHLSSEAMEGICFHCGDGDHNFGEFTDGTLFVGDVDYGDGKKVHGLHIATADYPEEGCVTICEFAAQLRKGVQS
ncbi:TPA: hypothetical protein ACJIWU_003265 [Enterobacter chengduensis]|uniref:hypothetical protein n=1 Tax=Enterobacter chengduensis TaxID=2494701 RepID=UPI001FF48741|nr:hypothetical protein [Enterobacter chengduensis]MCK1098956.1 hypothetical protein [Enterobacter chengduensis]